MTYRGYTIKQDKDGSYSVHVDGIEEMGDMPSVDVAKAFIDGMYNTPEMIDVFKPYAAKVKHLTRNQVDNYVYYDPRDYVDTNNIYQLSYKTKKDRISGLSRLKKNVKGVRVIDTTDNDEGRLPYWAFVEYSVPGLPESLQPKLNEDDNDVQDSTDKDIYDYLSGEYLSNVPELSSSLSTRQGLIDYIIEKVAGDVTKDHDPSDEYWNIYAATINEDISTQYSYNIVYNAIDEILDDVFYPILRKGIKETGDPLEELDYALENDLDMKSELAYINDLVSEYGDALKDVIDPDGAAARYYDEYQLDNDVDEQIMAMHDNKEN